MPVILDIRGTHGSGKTWIVRQLLARYDKEDLVYKGTPIGYALPAIDCAVLGRYVVQCGGLDETKSQEVIRERIRWAARTYQRLVFEGSFTSTICGPYVTLAKELLGYRFLFLDTPVRTCIARVTARRLQLGNTKVLNPKNLLAKHFNILGRIRTKLVWCGCRVVTLDYHNPLPTVWNELGL